MQVNSLIFPAPEPSYTEADFEDELIWVPHYGKPKKPCVPCLYLPYSEGSTKYLIYFHGNAEDIGYAFEMMDALRFYLRVHVIGVEYPGYGLYAGKPNASQILEDAEAVYKFFTGPLEVKSTDIIVFGRSIGSGPATYLAQDRNICALILMSAYTSIRNAVRNIAGRMAKLLVADRFNNLECISRVFCPTFIIHGQLDALIPFSHSQELHSRCVGPCFLHLPEDMDHNFFEYDEDLINPLLNFFENCGITFAPDTPPVTIPSGFFFAPPGQPVAKNKGRIHKLLTRFKKA